MNETTGNTERKAFQSYWNDGLLDIMLGLVLVVTGLSWWQGVAVLGALFPAVCVSMWYLLRKRLVEPRMGYVEFSGGREVKIRSFRFGLVAFFAGTMALGLVVYILWKGELTSDSVDWVAAFPLVLVAIPALFFSVFTNCRRFTVYALMLLLAGVTVVLQGWDPHVGMIAGGVIILVTGLIILAIFLSRHPAQPLETP